jgi:hypothetical protein
MPYMLISNTPTITTVPASPTVLLAATAKAATMTLTSAPAAPGQFLIFTIAGNSLAGTITITGGTDNYGAPASETIAISASATTVYSSRRYSALPTNQFATTGLSASGVTIGVTGVYAWNYTFTYDGVTNYTPYSATIEEYNGVFGYKLPYSFFSDGDFSWEKEKEIAFTAKGEAQDYLVIGDPTSTTGGTNPFGTLAQPTSLPVVSWPSSFFVDTGSGTAFTTQDGSLETFKISITTGRKSFRSGDGFQRWNNVTWDSEPDIALDASIVVANYQNYVNFFKTNQSLILGTTFQGNLLGTISGTTYYESISWTLPAKFDTWKTDMSKNPVEGTLKLMSEYNFSNLGYLYRCSWTAQVPPTYVA